MRSLKLAIAMVALAASAPCLADSAATYTYDALGRLTKVVNAGGRTDGVQSNYNYDDAGNRTNVTVTGAAAGRIIVLPLGGVTVLVVGIAS